MKVTIFKNILETSNPYYISIEKIIERIKEGNSRKLINKIRGEWTKEGRNEFKKQLPSICFSGIFSKRGNNYCKEHSGVVCLDFDHLEDVQKFKEYMMEDAYTMAAFISPSGDGVKVLVKIPANIDTHAASCRALADYHKGHKLDDFKDIARVCYESYDKHIYYNPESSIFTELIHEEIRQVKTTDVEKDTEKIFQNIKTWIEKSENYIDGNKHTFLVKIAGALNRFGVNQIDSEGLLIREYQFRASYVKPEDISKIVSKVYNTYSNQFNISYFEKSGIAIEKSTRKETAKDFQKQYVPEVLEEYELKKILAERFNDPDEIIEAPPTVLGIRRKDLKIAPIFTAGNISVIKGKAKSKKTYLLSMFTSSAVSNNEIFTNIVPSIPKNKKQILYFDTEQSKYHSSRLSNRIRKMSNCDNQHFGSFTFRGLDGKKIIALIDYSLVLYKEVSLIIIDQIADVVSSLNDEKEAVAIIKHLEFISNKYDIHICVIVHQNKDNNYAQGWLGTQLMKKAETIIEVQKNDMFPNVSIVKPDLTRDIEFDEFSIKINDFGYPEICSNFEHEQINDVDI